MNSGLCGSRMFLRGVGGARWVPCGHLGFNMWVSTRAAAGFGESQCRHLQLRESATRYKVIGERSRGRMGL